jgi:hypothetical protein
MARHRCQYLESKARLRLSVPDPLFFKYGNYFEPDSKRKTSTKSTCFGTAIFSEFTIFGKNYKMRVGALVD